MNAAQLRHRITIQSVATSRTANGGITETTSTFCETWAKVEGLRSLEFFQAKQVNSERASRFTIRYIEGITPQMRISWDSRTFQIEGVMDLDGRSRWLVLMGVEERL